VGAVERAITALDGVKSLDGRCEVFSSHFWWRKIAAMIRGISHEMVISSGKMMGTLYF